MDEDIDADDILATWAFIEGSTGATKARSDFEFAITPPGVAADVGGSGADVLTGFALADWILDVGKCMTNPSVDLAEHIDQLLQCDFAEQMHFFSRALEEWRIDDDDREHFEDIVSMLMLAAGAV